MIDIGIVMLIDAGIGSRIGAFVELPKDQIYGWTYRTVSQKDFTTLTTFSGLVMKRMQIDCYGTGDQVITLAANIDAILNGFQGTLNDPDSTFVSSCFSTDMMDFFQDAPRICRRMLEYEILYSQS